eukprot:3422513-Rhodomonas_salina.2
MLLSADAIPDTDIACGVSLSAYGLATRCPVLTWRMLLPYLLRACYAVPGTETAYGATGASHRPEPKAPLAGRAGSLSSYALRRYVRYCHSVCCCLPTGVLRDVRYCHSVCSRRRATSTGIASFALCCPVLTQLHPHTLTARDIRPPTRTLLTWNARY